MNLQEAVRSVLSQYAEFSGRARRSEYWWWTLATIILSIVAVVLDLIIGTGDFVETGVLEWVSYAATFVPTLAVGTRRLHDIGKSGWGQLLFFIPIVGWIILIVWFATDSHPGDNQYGPNPKGGTPSAYGQVPPTA